MFSRIGFLALSLAALCSFAPPQKPTKGETPKAAPGTTVTVEIPAVSVNVVVTDRKGNLITGLSRENFKVFDEGVEQEVTNFFPDKSAVSVVLLMESSRIITSLETDFWDAVDDFARFLRPDDYCALVTFDNRPRIAVDFTQDKNEVVKEARSRIFFKGFRDSCLSDAVIFVLDRMKEVQGKKAVVLLSTGLDTFSRATYSQALERAAAADTVIYALSMGQLTRAVNDMRYSDEFRAELNMADLRLKSFARKTGGEAFMPKFVTEYPSIFRIINLLIRHQYTLAFQPTGVKADGKFHKIRVEAAADIDHDGKPDTLKAVCREGYRAPK